MNTQRIERIELDIQELSLAEQVFLMERLVQRIRRAASETDASRQSQLSAMAGDREVQQELRLIEAEFADTEMDGLDEAA